MDDVVNADKVSVVRPIDLPSGTYSPDAVVMIDSGNRNEPLKKLPLGELMPKTDGVSVLKGNCADNSITPVTEGDTPEDWDCYEVEKEGEDIWIGDDKRVHAKAGWYHVDMGVYITSDDQEVDARAAISFGAYTGAPPGGWFDYSDYCCVDFDLSYEHENTHSVGFDIHVENDGDIIHLSASAPTEYTAACYLNWFSIHRIKGAGSGGGGGESQGGDAVVFKLKDYAADYLTGDTLWRDLISALLDDKAVGLVAPVEDSINALGWLDINYDIPDGYTKEQFIDELANEIPELNNLEFEFEVPLYGGALTMREAFAITPNGLALHYIAFVVAGFGLILEGGANELTCESVMPISTQGGFGIDHSKIGECVSALMAKGIPACYTGYNTTNELLINMGTITKISTDVLAGLPRTKGFWMEVVGAATWERNDPNHGIRFPITYEAMFYWTPPDPGILNDRGSWSIDHEEVFPLALDSRFVPAPIL